MTPNSALAESLRVQPIYNVLRYYSTRVFPGTRSTFLGVAPEDEQTIVPLVRFPPQPDGDPRPNSKIRFRRGESLAGITWELGSARLDWRARVILPIVMRLWQPIPAFDNRNQMVEHYAQVFKVPHETCRLLSDFMVHVRGTLAICVFSGDATQAAGVITIDSCRPWAFPTDQRGLQELVPRLAPAMRSIEQHFLNKHPDDSRYLVTDEDLLHAAAIKKDEDCFKLLFERCQPRLAKQFQALAPQLTDALLERMTVEAMVWLIDTAACSTAERIRSAGMEALLRASAQSSLVRVFRRDDAEKSAASTSPTEDMYDVHSLSTVERYVVKEYRSGEKDLATLASEMRASRGTIMSIYHSGLLAIRDAQQR